MNTKFYGGKYDAVFKNALANEENIDLLKIFLEKVLNIKINEIKLKPQELPKINIKVKTKTLDVLVKTDKETINIELNNGYYDELSTRNLAYICTIFGNSVFKGEDYDNISKHIGLNITWGLGESKSKENNYKIIDEKTKEIYCDKIEIIEFNMDKIMKLWYSKNKEAERYKYLIMLGLDKQEELEKISKEDSFMEKFKENVVKLNSDPAFIDVISYEEDAIKTQNTLIKDSKKKIAKEMLKKNLNIDLIAEVTGLSKEKVEEVKEKAISNDPAFIDVISYEEDAVKTQNTLISEATKKGIEQGIEKGIEKGATQKQLEIAKIMSEKDLNPNLIAEVTGLSKAEIETLK